MATSMALCCAASARVTFHFPVDRKRAPKWVHASPRASALPLQREASLVSDWDARFYFGDVPWSVATACFGERWDLLEGG